MVNKMGDIRKYNYQPIEHLLELNDYCLLDIIKHLNIWDLYNIGRVCYRLRCLVQCLKQKLKINSDEFLNLSSITTPQSPSATTAATSSSESYYVEPIITPNIYEKFFIIVGHHINTLNITDINPLLPKKSPEIFYKIINENCQQTLKHLRIANKIIFPMKIIDAVLKNLKSLEIDFFREIREPNEPNKIIEQQFITTTTTTTNNQTELYQLNGLTINCCSNLLTTNSLINLLMAMSIPKLKHLSFTNLYYINFQNDELHSSIIRLKNLECLTFDHVTTKHLNLKLIITKLNKLKRLRLIEYNDEFGSQIIHELFVQLVYDRHQLVELDLHNCCMHDRTYSLISQFTNLKILKMNKNFWMTDEHLKLMATIGGGGGASGASGGAGGDGGDIYNNNSVGLTHFYCFDCIGVTNDGLTEFVRRHRKLEFLDISWCFAITTIAVRNIWATILARQGYARTLNSTIRPFELVARGRSRIDKVLVKEQLREAKDKMFTVTFEPMSTTALYDTKVHKCQYIPNYNRYFYYKKE